MHVGAATMVPLALCRPSRRRANRAGTPQPSPPSPPICRPLPDPAGATSGALVSMTSAATAGTDWYGLNAAQQGLVVSLSLAGALLGSGGLPAAATGARMGWTAAVMAVSLAAFVPLHGPPALPPFFVVPQASTSVCWLRWPLCGPPLVDRSASLICRLLHLVLTTFLT